MNEYFERMRTAETMTRGQIYAYRAWEQTQRDVVDMFEVDSLPWGSELENGIMEEFVATLREAGVEQFAVTDHSTALMESLHALFALGCTLIEPTIVQRHPPHWGDTERHGLLFKTN